MKAQRRYIKRTAGQGNHGYLKDGQRPPEYAIWSALIQRCLNEKCREYPSYGGRGIKVCKRWLACNGFAYFLEDVGPRPFPDATLHRIENDGDYEPGNVIWATQKTQMRHTRRNRILTLDGRSQTAAEWAEELKMKIATLAQRLHKKWSDEKALTTPVKPRKPYSEWARHNPNPRKPGPKPRGQDASTTRTAHE
jgi:hypothetical protein